MRTIYFILLILFFSCHQKETAKPIDKIQPRESPYAKLLSFYPKVSFDTLLVHSGENPDEPGSAFHGRPLDSSSAAFFPENLAQVHWAEPPAIFACYQFAMDKGCIGLITRVPSVYVSSAIRLFVLDTIEGKIRESIELAEEVGDAGDVLYKKSWLFRGSQGQHDVFTWNKETHDHSVDEEPDTLIENWDSFFLIRLEKNREDTISKDSLGLTRSFGHLLNKQPAANLKLTKTN